MRKIFSKILVLLIIFALVIDQYNSAECSYSYMKSKYPFIFLYYIKETNLNSSNNYAYGVANGSNMYIATREGAGGIYFQKKFRVNPRFEAYLRIYFSAGRNSDDWAFDGFTILANKYNLGYITTGSYGGSISYYRMPYGFAAEADFYYNGEYNDRTTQTISIHEGITSSRYYCDPYEDSHTSQSILSSVSINNFYHTTFNKSVKL